MEGINNSDDRSYNAINNTHLEATYPIRVRTGKLATKILVAQQYPSRKGMQQRHPKIRAQLSSIRR